MGAADAAFAISYHLITMDLLGHGESELLPRGALLPDFVAWFNTALDELRLDRVSVAGHSMGALISGGLAALRPVCRVALLNWVYRRSPKARAVVEQRATAMQEDDFDSEAPLRRWFGAHETGREAFRQTHSWLELNNPEGYATAYAAFARGDTVYAEEWPRILVPALFLTGSDDPNSTPPRSRRPPPRRTAGAKSSKGTGKW